MGVIFGNAGAYERADDTAGCRSSNETERRRGEPAGGDDRAKPGNGQKTETCE